jgi:hypothetical protein
MLRQSSGDNHQSQSFPEPPRPPLAQFREEEKEDEDEEAMLELEEPGLQVDLYPLRFSRRGGEDANKHTHTRLVWEVLQVE